ncbi:hypothetical protein OCV73_14225 [Barnesiella propionica]|uniref:hypothetical protein n=1 Tax=Barnesiella propionica TaxID=2981781 RepID=UPI001431AE7B|nr:hypothetical protein [Barnesiella propionica]MCU6770092.1 hypothetical protein [Barnesiella propionica]
MKKYVILMLTLFFISCHNSKEAGLTEMVIKQRYLYMLHRIKGGYMGGLPWVAY